MILMVCKKTLHTQKDRAVVVALLVVVVCNCNYPQIKMRSKHKKPDVHTSEARTTG